MKHSNISIFIPHNGCPCKCSFCNQSRITGVNHQPTPEEVKKIIEDAALYMGDGEKIKNTEIAFFGGSFTAIDRSYMISLLSVTSELVKKYGFMGIRCSTRPDKIDREVLSILKKHNVTSIELGAQSMSDNVLTANNRGHLSEDVVNASILVKEYGFELGLQMMTGLYKSTPELDIFTANEIIKLKPETVRIYPTVTLENTALCDLYRSGEYKPMNLEDTVELCSTLLDMFEKEKIKVIRLGLHASEEVSEKKIAGAYHPAMREKCESRLLYKKILKELSLKEKGEYEIKVNNKLISKFIGQKKENLIKLSEEGYKIKIIQDENTEYYEITERIGEI